MDDGLGETDLLLQRAVQGDDGAIGELLEKHRAYLKVIARRMLGSGLGPRVDASDVVQQTMLSAYGKIRDFRGERASDFLAWLRVLHERNVQDVLRQHLGAEKRDIRREVEGGDPVADVRLAMPETASQRLMADEDAVRLARAIDSLPEHQQEAIRLRYLEGWPLERIATELERSGPAIVGLLTRGLRGLRSEMRANGEFSDGH